MVYATTMHKLCCICISYSLWNTARLAASAAAIDVNVTYLSHRCRARCLWPVDSNFCFGIIYFLFSLLHVSLHRFWFTVVSNVNLIRFVCVRFLYFFCHRFLVCPLSSSRQVPRVVSLVVYSLFYKTRMMCCCKFYRSTLVFRSFNSNYEYTRTVS